MNTELIRSLIEELTKEQQGRCVVHASTADRRMKITLDVPSDVASSVLGITGGPAEPVAAVLAHPLTMRAEAHGGALQLRLCPAELVAAGHHVAKEALSAKGVELCSLPEVQLTPIDGGAVRFVARATIVLPSKLRRLGAQSVTVLGYARVVGGWVELSGLAVRAGWVVRSAAAVAQVIRGGDTVRFRLPAQMAEFGIADIAVVADPDVSDVVWVCVRPGSAQQAGALAS